MASQCPIDQIATFLEVSLLCIRFMHIITLNSDNFLTNHFHFTDEGSEA